MKTYVGVDPAKLEIKINVNNDLSKISIRVSHFPITEDRDTSRSLM